MSDEHLWKELQEQERADDVRYHQNRSADALRGFTPKTIDHNAAIERYERDFVPMFAARRKVMRSKVFREKMRQSGDLKDMDLAPKDIVDPTRGMVSVGPTVEQIIRQIAKNPKAYRHLMKKSPKVGAVNAVRRTIDPVWKKDEGR